MERYINNYDRTIKLGPCKTCGGKPRLVNTHVACSNPRCDNFKHCFRDTSWNKDYKVDGISARAEDTWKEDYKIDSISARAEYTWKED